MYSSRKSILIYADIYKKVSIAAFQIENIIDVFYLLFSTQYWKEVVNANLDFLTAA